MAITSRLGHHFKLFKPLTDTAKLHELDRKMKEINHDIDPDFYWALKQCDRDLLLMKEEEL